MASQTVVSDHSEEVENQARSDMKKMEAENVSPLKESVESTKPEELVCPEAPSAESEAKMDEKKIEPTPVIEHVEDDIKEREKPIAEDLVDVVAEPIEQKTEDNQDETETKVAASSAEPIEQKTHDKTVELHPKVDEKKAEDIPFCEPSAEKAESKLEEKWESEPAEKQGEEKKVESIEENPEELAVILKGKIEKEELVECKAEEVSEAVAPNVQDKPLEQLCEFTEKIDNEPPEAEPVEKVEVKSHIFEKEEESSTAESSEQVKPENSASEVEEKEVECFLTDQVKEKKEPAEVKRKVKEPEKFEAETEAPEAKSEENSVVTKELVQCEEKTSEKAKTSHPSPELEEKAAAGDIKPITEDAKNETDKEVSKEPEKTEAAEKIKAVQATVQHMDEKIEESIEAKQVDEPPKTGDPNLECTKEIQDTKKSQNVPVKTQKQSIVKIVKQSLVKAKKAIIGKSQNSKTSASEPKDDGN